ncbi:pentapeptide repeat-containing protein [Okeania sp. SIO2B9]|uniref:pentapeptide repeat-containing protein n=1 Tax=Okeania sp. SIO2B9 TaxID=2607782 RepID=UPI00142AB89D|nr:pentapeptide repeat-containing protein [Okeania sp. SIO2B9]NES91527.1 low-complexity protein [Okeania sp. SIO2B9]
MFKDFPQQNLQGGTVKSQDNANFSHSKIQGRNFSQAMLVSGNFRYAQAGLKISWLLILGTILLFLAMLGGFICGYAGAFIGSILKWKGLTWIGPLLVLGFGLILFLGFILITIYRGIGTALWLFTIIVLTSIAMFMALPGTDDAGADARADAILLAFCIGINISGVLLEAIAIAVMRISFPNRMLLLLIQFVTLATAILGIIAATQEEDKNLLYTSAVVKILAIAIPATITLLALSLFIGCRAVVGDRKYALIRNIAIILCSYGGTSFYEANLTDANFSGASLKNTNLRKAILTRTCWLNAKHLDKARVEGTYLENKIIRQLVVTGNGRDQNFDNLDLRGCNLRYADLTDASFIGTKLSEATLEGANLTRAKLVKAQLYGTNLTNAILTGACIQDWAISLDTQFEGIKCDYVYMRLETKEDRDPWRKPDNRNEIFKDGDFSSFIAPIIKTKQLYQTQNVDPREVAENYSILDIFHHEGVDPSAAAIAFQRLIEKYPESGLQVLSIEGRGNEIVHFQAQVTDDVDRSFLSQEYNEIYHQIKSGSYPDLLALLAGVAEKDKHIIELRNLLETALKQNKFYVETYQETRNIEVQKGDYRETSVNDRGSYFEGDTHHNSPEKEREIN